MTGKNGVGQSAVCAPLPWFRTSSISVPSYLIALGLYVFLYLARPSFLGDVELLKRLLVPAYPALEVAILVLLGASYVTDRSAERPGRLALGLSIAGFVLQRAVSYGPSFDLATIFWFVLAYPRELRLEDAMKCMVGIGILTSAFIIVLGASGVITDNIRFSHGRLRHGLGFQLGVFLAYDLSAILMCWMYARLRRWRAVDYAISFSAALVIYGVGNGRGSFYMILGILVGIFVWRLLSSHAKARRLLAQATKVVAAASWPFLSLFTILSAIYLGNPEIYNNHELLSKMFGWLIGSRLKYWYINLQEFGLTLRGSVDRQSFPLDNLYLWLVLICGILVLMALCALHVAWVLHARAERDYYQLLYMVSLAVFSFTCMFTYSVLLNPVLLFIGKSLRCWNESKTEQNNALGAMESS